MYINSYSSVRTSHRAVTIITMAAFVSLVFYGGGGMMKKEGETKE